MSNPKTIVSGVVCECVPLEEIDRLRAENADLRNANRILRDALDAERAELAGMVAQRTAYAREFPPDAEGEPDTGSIHANIRAMKAELAELLTWMCNVPTDAQLDAEVPALGKQTGRQLLTRKGEGE